MSTSPLPTLRPQRISLVSLLGIKIRFGGTHLLSVLPCWARERVVHQGH